MIGLLMLATSLAHATSDAQMLEAVVRGAAYLIDAVTESPKPVIPADEIHVRCRHHGATCPGAEATLERNGRVLATRTLTADDAVVFTGATSGEYVVRLSYPRYGWPDLMAKTTAGRAVAFGDERLIP